jgi:hypothetical protein
VRFKNFIGGGFHAGNFTAKFTTCDSHKIVPDLFGFVPNTASVTVPVDFAAWVAFDFEAIAGSVIARVV